MKNCGFTMKHGGFTMKNGSFTMKNSGFTNYIYIIIYICLNRKMMV
jgi:hypothetical protein